MIKKIIWFLLISFHFLNLSATDYYSRSDGTWSTVSLNGTACGCTPSGGTSNDNFTVSHTISVSLSDITIKGDVIVNDGGNLSFSGNVTFHNNSDVTVNEGGTFHVGGDFVNNNNSTDVVISGTLDVDGDFTNSSNGEIVISASGNIEIGGSCSNPGTVGENGTEITGCIGASNPLPVELINFKASLKTNHITLNWETATELNNDYFIVERSQNGSSFSEINKTYGNGTTSHKSEYQYEDKSLVNGSYYYRLKQVDFDGAYEYSNVIYIQILDKGNSYLHSYPNPVQQGNKLMINYHSFGSKTIFQLYDLTGKIVWSKTNGNEDGNSQHTFQIETSDLPKGMLILRMISNDQTQTKRIKVN